MKKRIAPKRKHVKRHGPHAPKDVPRCQWERCCWHKQGPSLRSVCCWCGEFR